MKVSWIMALLVLSSLATAEEPVSKSFFGGVAIGGMDTVAYHTQEARDSGESVAGNDRYEFEWKGATWRFANEASRDKFAENPDKWVPEFNGHCANALSIGQGLVKTDGSVWQFFDDKLYLFYAEAGLKRWQGGDFRKYRQKAEEAWLEIVQGD